MKLSAKYLLFGAFIGLGLFLGIIRFLPDNRLHVVFCNVGQGDAIYIKFPNQTDMLVDGGPNDKVLSCLGQYMPFYDRKIDLVVATHPQADHISGLLSVLNRYEVGYLLSDINEQTGSGSWLKLLKIANSQKISQKKIYAGMTIKIDKTQIFDLWPEKNLIAQNILGAMSDEEINMFSPYLLVKYGNFKLLLTGDGDETAQKQIMNTEVIKEIGQIQVLKVPHHGSKKSISDGFLQIIKPELSVISVGKNSYGHPNPETVAKLEIIGKVARTDKQGNIEIISDGNKWLIN